MKTILLVFSLIFFSHTGNGQSIPQKSRIAITFKKANNVNDIKKQYPVLTELLSDLEETDVYFAKAKSGSASLLFVRFEGILYRGTEGTPLTVFMDTGSGYKQVLDVTTQSDITLSDKSPPIIYLRSRTGKTTAWEYDQRNKQYRLDKK